MTSWWPFSNKTDLFFFNTMKILHALVGYLTFTALQPLPFHSFVFASPLETTTIDCDGYVNITQNYRDFEAARMKHILGILESDTTTPQTHKDSALMKRVPGDIIEARWAELAPPVLVVISIVVAVTLLIVWAEDDDPVRGNNAEFLVEHFD